VGTRFCVGTDINTWFYGRNAGMYQIVICCSLSLICFVNIRSVLKLYCSYIVNMDFLCCRRQQNIFRTDNNTWWCLNHPVLDYRPRQYVGSVYNPWQPEVRWKSVFIQSCSSGIVGYHCLIFLFIILTSTYRLHETHLAIIVCFLF
jgi:hypothetical protein